MGAGGGGERGGGESDGTLRRRLWTGAKELSNWSHVPIGRLVLGVIKR